MIEAMTRIIFARLLKFEKDVKIGILHRNADKTLKERICRKPSAYGIWLTSFGNFKAKVGCISFLKKGLHLRFFSPKFNLKLFEEVCKEEKSFWKFRDGKDQLPYFASNNLHI